MKHFKIKSIFMLVALSILVFSGCKRKANNTLIIAGSDTMVQLAQNISVSYMKKNSGKLVSVRGGGSGTGVASLLNGSIQIANASRKMKQKEWNKAASLKIKIKEHIVGLDGIAVLVHPDNPVNKLTIKQLSNIFSGDIRNWKKLGGKDKPISVISRENNSGTHVYFKEKVLRQGDKNSRLEFGDKVIYAVSSQQIIDQIKSNREAIAYVGMGWVAPGVKALKVSKKGKNYYSPTVKEVKNNNYPIARTLQMYTNEKYKIQSEHFIQFVMSKAGQGVVKKLGFVPVQ